MENGEVRRAQILPDALRHVHREGGPSPCPSLSVDSYLYNREVGCTNCISTSNCAGE